MHFHVTSTALLLATLALSAQAAPLAPRADTTTRSTVLHRPRQDTEPDEQHISTDKPAVDGPESDYPFRAFVGSTCEGSPQPGEAVAQMAPASPPATPTMWTPEAPVGCWNHHDVGSVGMYPWESEDGTTCTLWWYPEVDCGGRGDQLSYPGSEGLCLPKQFTSLSWDCWTPPNGTG